MIRTGSWRKVMCGLAGNLSRPAQSRHRLRLQVDRAYGRVGKEGSSLPVMMGSFIRIQNVVVGGR